jgi:hypothetical protein
MEQLATYDQDVRLRHLVERIRSQGDEEAIHSPEPASLTLRKTKLKHQWMCLTELSPDQGSETLQQQARSSVRRSRNVDVARQRAHAAVPTGGSIPISTRVIGNRSACA